MAGDRPNFEEAVRALGKISRFDRRRCRAVFEEKFTAARMAKDYIDLYERVKVGTKVVVM